MFDWLYSVFIDSEHHPRAAKSILAVTVLVFWFYASWSFGILPVFGEGFAKASDVTNISITLLERDMIDTRTRHCLSPAESDMQRFFYARIQEIRRKYFDLTGQAFDLPACRELVNVNAT